MLYLHTGKLPHPHQIEQHLKRAIGSDYKKMELTSSMSHKHFVRENVGVSIFTSTAHSELLDGTVRIPIENLPISPPIGLLTNQKKKILIAQRKNLSTGLFIILMIKKTARLKISLTVFFIKILIAYSPLSLANYHDTLSFLSA